MVDTERLKGRCTYLYTYLPTYVLLNDRYYGMCNVPLCCPCIMCLPHAVKPVCACIVSSPVTSYLLYVYKSVYSFLNVVRCAGLCLEYYLNDCMDTS